MKNKVLFLDRDGNINVDYIGVYLLEKNKFILIPGVAQALSRALKAGFKLVVITNQACVEKGILSPRELDGLHEYMVELLLKDAPGALPANGKIFDAIYYCPHLPESACNCRKPETKLLKEAIQFTNADLDRSYFIGDKAIDVECGAREKVKGILVRTGHGANEERKIKQGEIPTKPHAVVDSLVEAIDIAIRETA